MSLKEISKILKEYASPEEWRKHMETEKLCWEEFRELDDFEDEKRQQMLQWITDYRRWKAAQVKARSAGKANESNSR